jgi:ribonuclease HI
MDSELLVRQLKGIYRVRAADLKPLYDQACRSLAQFGHYSIHHIPREQNRRADKLANEALDKA